MKKGEVDRSEMTVKLEERNKAKPEEPTTRVDAFEARNRIHFINKSVMGVVRFDSGPVKSILGWLDRIEDDPQAPDQPRGADERDGNKPPLHEARGLGMGLKSRVGVYLLELVRLLQYTWEPSSRVNGCGGSKR